MKTLKKITSVLLFSLIYFSFISCTPDNTDEEVDCKACIQTQIELCEALGNNNCKPNGATDKIKQRLIDLCPEGEEKAKYIQLRCWRVDNLECSAQGFTCD